MIYKLLYKMLRESVDITNRVGTRIFAENAPEDAKGPCIIIRVLSGEGHYHLGGETSTANPTCQIDCYDDSATKANRLFELVRNRISGFYGTVEGVLDEQGELVDLDAEIMLLRPGALVNEPQDASDKWSYRWSADFEVFHEQSVPTLT